MIFHVFICVFTSAGFLGTRMQNNQLSGLIAQLVEHCIGFPVQIYGHSYICLNNTHLSLCPDPSPPLTIKYSLESPYPL